VCYIPCVEYSEISARDLRNHTRDVLRRAERGEQVRITVNRKPVAELRPIDDRPIWVAGATMERVIAATPADPAMLDDLRPLREQVIEAR
jgi:prevent-host-death family protein